MPSSGTSATALLTDRGLGNLSDLISLVKLENRYQLKKWGTQTLDASWWLTFLTEEIGELAEAIAEYYFRDGRSQDAAAEAIQVATMALKIAEMMRSLPKGPLTPPTESETSTECPD